MAVQMKASEYFPVAMFIMLYKVSPVDENLNRTIQMKANNKQHM